MLDSVWSVNGKWWWWWYCCWIRRIYTAAATGEYRIVFWHFCAFLDNTSFMCCTTAIAGFVSFFLRLSRLGKMICAKVGQHHRCSMKNLPYFRFQIDFVDFIMFCSQTYSYNFLFMWWNLIQRWSNSIGFFLSLFFIWLLLKTACINTLYH